MSASQVILDGTPAISVPTLSASVTPAAQRMEVFFERPRWTPDDRSLILVWCGSWSAQRALARAHARRASARTLSVHWLIDIDYAGSPVASLEVSEGEAVCRSLNPHAGGRLRSDAFSFRVREPSPSAFMGRVAVWLSLRPATDAEVSAAALFPENSPEALQLDVASLASLRGALLG